MQDCHIVIPCYNEAERLPVARFDAFLTAHPRFSFTFVSDGSVDDTTRVIEALAARHAHATTLVLERNLGKAEAVRLGIMAACGTETAFVGYLDADLSTPIEDVPALLQVRERHPACRCIIGSRIKRLGADIERKWWRHLVGRVFATLADTSLGIGVYDTQCGAKLFERQLAQAVFAEPFISRWLFDVELLHRIVSRCGVEAVYEYPLTTWRDVHGSKVKASSFLRAPFDLARIVMHYRYQSAPPTLPAAGDSQEAEKRSEPVTDL